MQEGQTSREIHEIDCTRKDMREEIYRKWNHCTIDNCKDCQDIYLKTSNLVTGMSTTAAYQNCEITSYGKHGCTKIFSGKRENKFVIQWDVDKNGKQEIRVAVTHQSWEMRLKGLFKSSCKILFGVVLMQYSPLGDFGLVDSVLGHVLGTF